MKVEKKDLEKSQIELTVELSVGEFKPYIKQGAEKVSKEVKINGFRSGKAPYEVLKQKIGEMTILEEAARIAINKTIELATKDKVTGQPVGQPQVNITKLAPNNPMQYKVVLAMLPEVKLGDYKKAKVKQEKIEVKDSEIEKMIEYLREMRVKEAVADCKAKDGDKVIVDIEMFLDKVPVDGGQGKDTGVIIGKGYVVPGFGKKLIGAGKSEVREFSLPYPKDHHQANLAGKLVDFKVKIKEVYQRELPKINDDFAQNFKAKDLAELRGNIKKNIIAEKQQRAEQKTEIAMLDKILEKTKFGDIPELLVNHEAETMLAELEQTVAQQGGKFDDYLASLKKTRDQLTLDLLPDAVKRAKSALMIRELAKVEKIKVEEKEVQKVIEEMLKQYKGNKEAMEKIKTPAHKEYMRNLMTNRKVIDKLKEWNVGKAEKE